MFLLLYNIIQIMALFLLWPVALLVVCCVPKYRGRIAGRLGFGLKNIFINKRRKRIWVHALSVGESASAKPLISAIKRKYPEVFIIFSTTTRGGAQFTGSMADLVDCVIPFPLDIVFVVKKFVRSLRPDLFILIETDFWPNLLSQLQKKKVVCLLANGRITEESIQRYAKCRPLFRQLFDSFDYLFMQTEKDAENMVKLGVSSHKAAIIGNLKYDMPDIHQDPSFSGKEFMDELRIGPVERIFVAGSTHPGEEEKIVRVFKKLHQKFAGLFLVIAPRDVARGAEIVKIAEKEGLKARRRTGPYRDNTLVLVLDTLGELTRMYAFADVVFVGGSMVDEGGHNPLEPAFFGKPVVFGESMTDFLEIVRDLEEVGAVEKIKNEKELYDVLVKILSDDVARKQMGDQGALLVRKHRGAAERYVERIGQVLQL